MALLENNTELLVLGGLFLLLLAGAGLWLRQSRIIRLLEQGRERDTAASERLEGLLRETERLMLHEFATASERDRESAHVLQRRLLLQISKLYQALERRFGEMQKHLSDDVGNLKTDLVDRFDGLHGGLNRSLAESRVAQQEALAKGYEGMARQLAEGLNLNAEAVGKRMDGLTERTDQRLQEIGGQVERRLNEGFEKTTETFTRVLEHLGRIDEAQKRITELSSNVVSLQEVLADKRSRGAFGEVQLNSL
ncbi:MAG: DNA recombination protein RmuC, partial [Sedimenticola sp.]